MNESLALPLESSLVKVYLQYLVLTCAQLLSTASGNLLKLRFSQHKCLGHFHLVFDFERTLRLSEVWRKPPGLCLLETSAKN